MASVLRARWVDSTADFARVVTPLVAADPIGHSVLATSMTQALTHAAGTADGAAPDVLWWVVEEADGRVVAAGQHWFPHFLGAQGMPDELAGDAAGPVADLFVARDRRPKGVAGPRRAALALAAAFRDRVGVTSDVTRELGAWVLGDLSPPDGVPGTARPPKAADADVLLRWLRAFMAEIGIGVDVHAGEVRRLIEDGGLVVWEVDGRPVSLAGWKQPQHGVARVGPVWTPVELRGQGYGAAVTAAASRSAVDAGSDRVCLYTDLANPVSNGIYARLGYQRVGDAVEITFDWS